MRNRSGVGRTGVVSFGRTCLRLLAESSSYTMRQMRGILLETGVIFVFVASCHSRSIEKRSLTVCTIRRRVEELQLWIWMIKTPGSDDIWLMHRLKHLPQTLLFPIVSLGPNHHKNQFLSLVHPEIAVLLQVVEFLLDNTPRGPMSHGQYPQKFDVSWMRI